MASPQWRAIRLAAIRSAHFMCEHRDEQGRYDCLLHRPDGKGLEVHHLHYETFGQENVNCLMVVCPPHHEDEDAKRSIASWEQSRGRHYARVAGFARAKWGPDWDAEVFFAEADKEFAKWRDAGAPKANGYPSW